MNNIVRTTVIPVFLGMFAAQSLAQKRDFLSLEAAQAGIADCILYAQQNNLKFAIAVLDRGGNTVAFARMDDVYQKQAELAVIKAETASTTPLSTKQIKDAVSNNPSYRGLAFVPGVSTVEGGVPIRLTSGYSVGGVGVSGSTPELDGVCATRAASAISERLQVPKLSQK
ncbi:heme-binding protein [Glaciecola siphonariae]|uniref:Heme-binding protein n=1 Tax=Glaciecola siphonariae TaxID=521012 RepID=A0ABV9LRD4_9ALTE